MKRPARLRATLWTLVLAALGLSCASPTTLPPVDLSLPGWTLTESAAVWRPRADAPELIGELTVARHTNGARWVQFSKQGLPVVTARLTSDAWEISSALRSRAFAGKSPPPERILWFHLEGLPPRASLRPPWTLVTNGGVWRITNRQTGEFLEGVGE